MDGVLNSCETDTDNDSVPDDCDNCDLTANLDQADTDGDKVGDACDECPMDGDKVIPGACGCGLADIDTDGDGIADCNDQCINDPLKSVAGACGCGIADTDTDGDGTADCNDECVNDEEKTEEGICGCGVADTDTDGDATADCNETCVNDPAKLAPGICGCGTADTDTDGDGTADCNDECINDEDKTDEGICGCGVAETDTDGDGTPDCNDECINDDEKIVAGDCGCGVADTDTDGDGTADCNDACVADPAKTAVGICGCGVADTDTDSDGTADCIEACDTDPLKTAEGICGCGVADTDTDLDGTADCNDECVSDATKVDSGICGCGVADTDTDSDGTADCNETCDLDAEKTEEGVCGCGVPDLDENKDNIIDCICDGICTSADPERDDDKDGVSNCEEIDDQTSPCDPGSFIQKLEPSACAGPNGFFGQVNVATVLNHQPTPLNFRVEYRDLTGAMKGETEFTLGGLLKRDVIVNDLGLEQDSYGTLCVYTDATVNGAWSGGLSIYKEQIIDGTLGLTDSDTFDFALHYPFSNPIHQASTVPLNTNALGTDGRGTIANWVRLTDAIAGDGKGLQGVLKFYVGNGQQVAQTFVNLPDGGRFDFPGHEPVGFRGLGMAQFVPLDDDQKYYIESSRYFYQGELATGSNFYTAFTVPNRPPTGEGTTGRISAKTGELSIIEIVNASDEDVVADLKVFDALGGISKEEKPFIPARGSFHRVVTGDLLASGSVASAETSGPNGSLTSMTLIYQFSPEGELLLAYAPPFAESAGMVQITDFNSFLGHKNVLELANTTDQQIDVTVSIFDYLNQPLPGFDVKLAPRGTNSIELAVPKDTYGTVVVDSSPVVGVVVRNDVVREGQYVVSFQGR